MLCEAYNWSSWRARPQTFSKTEPLPTPHSKEYETPRMEFSKTTSANYSKGYQEVDFRRIWKYSAPTSFAIKDDQFEGRPPETKNSRRTIKTKREIANLFISAIRRGKT